jgi:GTPase involved in cell partitioning and DNA repair
MVQKTWRGLSLILLLQLSGCYKFAASPRQMSNLEKEVEVVEEELGDFDERIVERKVYIKKQMVVVKRMDAERKLFFGAMNRQSIAITQDINEFKDGVNSFLASVIKLKGEIEALLRLQSYQKDEATNRWKVKLQTLKSRLCSLWPQGKCI